jgi:hypothetical protein
VSRVNDDGHAPFDALAAGFALSALEPEDELLFLTHLAHCPACEHEVAAHCEIVAHLAFATPDEAPPASLLNGIRAGVAGRRDDDAPPAPPNLDAARERRRSRSAALATGLVGTAAALLVAVALLVLGRGPTAKERNAQLVADRLTSTASSLLVPGARKVVLEGDGARGAVIVNGRSVSLVMSGVAVNDRRSSVYVLWEKTTFGDVRAVGSFDVTSSALSVINNLRLASADTVRAFIVTHEHGRAVPVRTLEPPVLAGEAS